MNTKYKLKTFNYSLNNFLTPTDIGLALDKFYSEELIHSEYKFSIIFWIKTSDDGWKNISSLQTLNKIDINKLKEIFNIFWLYKSNTYKGIKIEYIIFRYILLEYDIAPTHSIFKYPTDFEKRNELLLQDYTNLPDNRSFESWGDELVINGDNTYIVNKDDNHSFYITQFENEYYVLLKFQEEEIYNFHDTYDSNDKFNTFIRSIGNYSLYYRNGLCYLL